MVSPLAARMAPLPPIATRLGIAAPRVPVLPSAASTPVAALCSRNRLLHTFVDPSRTSTSSLLPKRNVGSSSVLGLGRSLGASLCQSHLGRPGLRLGLGGPLPSHPSLLSSSFRYASTGTPTTLHRHESFLRRFPFIKWVIYGTFSIVFGLTATVLIILAHDALTYGHKQMDTVHPSPLALHPEPGGPKNLPIVAEYVENQEDDEHKALCDKERLVIVGGGWAAVSLLSTLDHGKYNVTLVSPNNFYLFTPLLPSATVGTVEPRSLIEPLRKVLAPHRAHYIQGEAVDVEFGTTSTPGDKQRLLEVKLVSGEENYHMPGRKHPEVAETTSSGVPPREEIKDRRVYVPYDKLVVAVGSVTSTHGVPGLENAFHLKDIADARGIRNRILDNLEIASLPTTTPEERERLLSFVISGGGPTGVETASEIYDMLDEDVLDYFPKLLRQQAKVHLIQSRGHILNTYAEKISDYAEKKFQRDEVDVVLNARVKEVKPNSVVYTVKDADGKTVEHEVPSGMTLWSTGIAMSPFTKRLVNVLPNQSHLKALMVDSHLRVKGTPQSTVYALGDASTIDTRLIDYLYEFVDSCDTDHDGRLTFPEFQNLATRVGKKFPIASKHFSKLQDLFDTYDRDHDGSLTINEVADLFLETQSKMTALPATAQVASQQGKYLGKKLNKLAKLKESGKLPSSPSSSSSSSSSESSKSASESQSQSQPGSSPSSPDLDDLHTPAFSYSNLGSLAYISGSAAFELPFLPEPLSSYAGGLIALYAWRSFYLSEQVSTRTRMLLLSDYIRRGIWGRDLSRI